MEEIKNDDMQEIINSYRYADFPDYLRAIATLARYIDNLIQEVEELKQKIERLEDA